MCHKLWWQSSRRVNSSSLNSKLPVTPESRFFPPSICNLEDTAVLLTIFVSEFVGVLLVHLTIFINSVCVNFFFRFIQNVWIAVPDWSNHGIWLAEHFIILCKRSWATCYCWTNVLCCYYFLKISEYETSVLGLLDEDCFLKFKLSSVCCHKFSHVFKCDKAWNQVWFQVVQK